MEDAEAERISSWLDTTDKGEVQRGLASSCDGSTATRGASIGATPQGTKSWNIARFEDEETPLEAKGLHDDLEAVLDSKFISAWSSQR